MEFLAGERRGIPSGATLFSAYASLSATYTLLQQAFYQFVPPFVRAYLYALFNQWFTRNKPPPKDICKLIIEEGHNNTVFEACQVYLCNKLSDSCSLLKVSRGPNEGTMSFKLAEGVKYSETYEGILLKWEFCYATSSSSSSSSRGESHHGYPPYWPSDEKQSDKAKSYFSLVFDKEHKKKVCSSYLPYIEEASKDVQRGKKVIKITDCKNQSVNMTHPFTFENLAMDPDAKKAIMDDLDRFVRRKEFYRRVGKPWKRGYLLYGPPGTGKSSLIAAMANYLKFNIHDLQLGSASDSSLKHLLLSVPSQSIIVVEDIDCNRGLPRRTSHGSYDNLPRMINRGPQMSFAALLNFVDGLWSCCGDERLIVFTTNHKEKLDPALLRPGRMDMHIHMSYLTMEGFKVLAYNYLRVSNHQLFQEIQSLLGAVDMSPAEVSEELMRSEDVDVALEGVVELLKRKKVEAEDAVRLKLEAEKNAEDTENNASGEVNKGKLADAKSEAVCAPNFVADDESEFEDEETEDTIIA